MSESRAVEVEHAKIYMDLSILASSFEMVTGARGLSLLHVLSQKCRKELNSQQTYRMHFIILAPNENNGCSRKNTFWSQILSARSRQVEFSLLVQTVIGKIMGKIRWAVFFS